MKELNQIIASCKDENRNAQSQLYQLFAPGLFAICLRYCANNNDAEDCLHDSFLKIFKNIKNYKGKGSFEGWLKRIVVNTCIDTHRNKAEVIDLEEEAIEDENNEENENNYAHIDKELLLKIIRELPPRYGMVFNLYVFEELKHKEIATRMKISTGTSKSNYLRAKKMIAERIKKEMKK